MFINVIKLVKFPFNYLNYFTSDDSDKIDIKTNLASGF